MGPATLRTYIPPHPELFTAFGSSHNITNLNDTNLEVDPRFVAFSDDGDPTNDELYLRPSSPRVDESRIQRFLTLSE